MNAEFGHVDRRMRHRLATARRRQLVIEGAGEDARGRGLADPAHAGQNIGLMDSLEVEGIRQRPDHGLLADQILETRGPIFAGEHAIGSLEAARAFARRPIRDLGRLSSWAVERPSMRSSGIERASRGF